MHIIKISQTGFKIILSKSELEIPDGNIFDSSIKTNDFLRKIIEETNYLYGNPFISGCIDAEFFASKDGGGELFISKSRNTDTSTYLFTCGSIDIIISLCKRLSKNTLPDGSSLYKTAEKYYLLMDFSGDEGMIKAILSEYGNAERVDKQRKWYLDEHCKSILPSDAVKTISRRF